MKKTTKIVLLAATAVTVLGILLAGGILFFVQADLTKLSSDTYVEKVYKIDQNFEHISINLRDADITFALSQDGKCRVESKETEQYGLLVTVEKNTLTIKLDKDQAPPFFAMSFLETELTVYLPKCQYESIHLEQDTGDITMPTDFCFTEAQIDTSTGDIRWSGVVTSRLELETTTGDVYLTNAQCGNVEIEVTTGDVTVTDTVAGEFSLELTTGDVILERFDAAGISVENTTGDITCNLLSGKMFVAETLTGDVNVPVSTEGVPCYLYTTTGHITVTIANEN